MKFKNYLWLFIVASFVMIQAQDTKWQDKGIAKESAIEDRAGGVHNAGNIGLFFENRGKLYPRRISQGPSGEFPINSGKNYIYRINPMVGIPGNVIQGRYTENEEWEAAYGYHNREVSNIAFSDNPKTWPSSGWPVKDEYGNPVFKSDQDSYAVYTDSNNTKQILNIEVAQTGYAYGVSFAQDILFFTYEIKNNSNETYNDLYFGLYADIDVGNISGGVAEYDDDFVDFDKANELLYFYDDGVSTEWPDNKTGVFGIAFLRTPDIDGKMAGITDMHYNLYFDDRDIDSVQYGIMSSSTSLYNSSLGDAYFHTGGNSNLHFDDPSTIPAGGLDLVATVASGPYTIKPGESIKIVTALVAGENKSEMYNALQNAQKIVDFDFEISKPPLTPTLSGIAGDSEVTLYWNSDAELSRDNFSGEYDFEGYRLYRSNDKGINWTELVDYDLKNKIGLNLGLEYSYTDTKVTNGFEYWYSVTAYDRGDSIVSSLESPRGSNIDAINLVAVTPYSAPLGYNPASAYEVIKLEGKSNYNVSIAPVDNEEIFGDEYELGFTYVARTEIGRLNTLVEIVITDPENTVYNNWGLEWTAPDRIQFIDLTTGDYLRADPYTYRTGVPYKLNNGLSVKFREPDPNASPELKPKAGDYIKVSFASYVVKNGTDTVVSPQPFEAGKLNSTPGGVLFTLNRPDYFSDVSRIGGTDKFDIRLALEDETTLLDTTYFVSVTGNGTDNNGTGFISVEMKYSDMTLVTSIDTLYNLETINFNGVTVSVEFNSEKLPASGNTYSFKSIIPVLPNVTDKYGWKIAGSSINRAAIKEEINNIKVVPNPYIVSSLYEPEYGELRKEPLRQIQFINLPSECTINIFTIDADMIKTIYHSSLSGTAVWDLRTEGGREAAPGIYIYVVKTPEAEYMNRFAIIK